MKDDDDSTLPPPPPPSHPHPDDLKQNGTVNENEFSVEIPPTSVVKRMEKAERRKAKRGCWTNKVILGTIAAIVLLVLIIVLCTGFGTGAFGGSGSKSENEATSPKSPTEPSTPAPAAAIPSPTQTTEREESFMELLTRASYLPDPFDDENSNEYKAMSFLANDDPLQLDPSNEEDHMRIRQRYGLLVMYFSDNELNDTSNWLTENECDWFGVVCEEISQTNGRKLQQYEEVVYFTWPGQNYEGTIAPDVAILTSLILLDISNNQIFGSIPPSFADLSNLEGLYLRNNTLSGNFDDVDWSGLERLVQLDLSENYIGGNLGDSIFDVRTLEDVILNTNYIGGEIPMSIGNLQQLRILDIRSTNLSGQIPTQIAMIPTLTSIQVRDTYIGGTIPTEIGDIPGLVAFDGRETYLEGSIPTEVSQVEALEFFAVSNSNMTGPVDNIFGGLPNLSKSARSLCNCPRTPTISYIYGRISFA